MEWYFIPVFTLIYIAGVAFTFGARLWPRWRDANGQIRPNPLHAVEAHLLARGMANVGSGMVLLVAD